METIPVCTGYRFEGETLDEMPSDTWVLEACEPVYEMLPGWKCADRRHPRVAATCPANAKRYLERLAELVGTEIGLVSTGPDRSQTILRSKSALASWFD